VQGESLEFRSHRAEGIVSAEPGSAALHMLNSLEKCVCLVPVRAEENGTFTCELSKTRG